MCAEEKRNKNGQKRRGQRGRRQSMFVSCLLVICLLVLFTDNATKTVKATEVAAAEAEMGSEAVEATEKAAEELAMESGIAPEASEELAEEGGIVQEASEVPEELAMEGGIAPEATEVQEASEVPEKCGEAEVPENIGAGQEEEAAETDAPENVGAGQEEEAAETETPETKVMYLTFDDGPSAETTEQILDILKERNIKATFFVIGENVRKHPEIARRIAEEGHTIGIHCDVHDYETIYESVDSYIADFEKAYDTVLSVTGVEAKIFRFPGGSINAYNQDVYKAIIAEMEARGFVYFDWNASVEDAAGGKPTPEELVQNAVDTSLGRQKVIMLAHDRVENTALALETLLDAFPEYRMEPLTEETTPIQF